MARLKLGIAAAFLMVVAASSQAQSVGKITGVVGGAAGSAAASVGVSAGAGGSEHLAEAEEQLISVP